MVNLNFLELTRLKSLLSGKTLTIGEKISTLDMLRSRFPDFLSNPIFNLTKENLKDNNFLIKYLTNPYNRNKIKNALRKELSLSPTQQVELEKSLEEPVELQEAGTTATDQEVPSEQAAPVGQSAGSAAGGMPEMPSAPSISFGSRGSQSLIHNIPHVPEPETKIALANKSGAVVGEATITPTSTTIRGTAPETSKLYTANSSGVITGERGLKAETPQPKLVIANKSSVVAEAPPSKIFIARSDGTVLREHAIKPMSRFSAFRSKMGGKITNAARIGLEKANPFLKRAGNGLVNSLSSIANPGSMGGAGSRSIFGKVSRFGRGGGRAVSSAGKTIKKSRGLLALIGILGFVMLTGAIAISGTPSTGEAVPITPPGNNAPTAPCTNGDYKTCLSTNYKLAFQPGFSDSFLQMAYQALSSTETIAPKFKNLIHNSCPTITVAPTTNTSHISGCTANLKTTINQLTLIHELSHIIHNSNPSYYKGIITQARTLDSADWEGGFLTYYSKYASRPDDFKINCYPESTGEQYLLDEEFAESVTYFINSNTNEINMGSGCQTKWSDNPYQKGNRYKGHYNLISEILK
ncbi:hypothetical protein A3I48_01420 [Candidatus Daviesbacteria bacterium RIFCSPLOWO2_02_FULL_36_7]|uniref:Uncharacterized protein n=1 Tax=Candidatus Daviesbacteria bacterium RIFCSPLOWO2_02_FULL_36_7 TaxID=1797792 RepID=A0A1F5MID9_9BACT|nr:MAG: hypothetical protein A3I48_01420 [Candidatus Daviesbacteria bacterium RIFCSPLOWO2_02_FULL_36_7]